MTVVAPETTLPAETRQERKKRASTLEAAALEIEKNGWCRYTLEDTDGALCVFGAISKAAPEATNPSGNWKAWEAIWGGDVPTLEDQTLPSFDDGARPLVYFNDVLARDSSEVTFLLRWRAQEIKDGL